MLPDTLPQWEDIPPVEGMPHGTAWNVWGREDQLGALNLLTPKNTVEAMKESRDRHYMDLTKTHRDTPKYPAFQRRPFEHKMLFKPFSAQDELHFNTQSSSQWDGFRHIAHPPTKLFYNGLPIEDVSSGKEPFRNGIHHWVEAGGIAGRGVLLDWVRWYTHTHPTTPLPHPCTSHKIPISELEATAKYQGVDFKVGDILLVRSGFIKWYNDQSTSDEDRKVRVAENGMQFIGVESGDETKKWIWNHHFAAVGGDAVAFETYPVTDLTQSLHQWLLPLAGIPIGELFNLEGLSVACEQEKKWTFFLTSAPLNVPGGVASCPNAIAIL